MNNTLIITDDELALIQTALFIQTKANEKYRQIHGEGSLDYDTMEAFYGMQKLLARLEREFN